MLISICNPLRVTVEERRSGIKFLELFDIIKTTGCPLSVIYAQVEKNFLRMWKIAREKNSCRLKHMNVSTPVLGVRHSEQHCENT